MVPLVPNKFFLSKNCIAPISLINGAPEACEISEITWELIWLKFLHIFPLKNFL